MPYPFIHPDGPRFSVTARWVFPISTPPLENGVVEVANGRIVAVHDRPNPSAVNLGNVAIIPGLVNAHTHLEFSDLTQPVQPALPFTEWIRSLVTVRRTTPATHIVIQAGLNECHANGATLVGEIATQHWSADDYRHAGTHVTVFRELIGLLPDRAAAQFAIAQNWLAHSSDNASITRGLSPHAPYSVHPSLYHDLIELAADHQAPIAIHLAETTSELELLNQGTGEFVAMLQRFNAWDDHAIPRGSRPLDYLTPLAGLSRALVIHGNYLDSQEIDWLDQHPNVAVVYCPRTHAFFQHPPHPWLHMLDRGICVALGTDSRGSNPDLSLWREMRFLVTQFPQVDPARILAMGTLAGAQALGQNADYGTLEPGKRATLTVVDLPAFGENDPYRLLLTEAL